jgi:hypothetical protein
MGGLISPMSIKFLFKELINGGIEVEGKPRRPVHAKSSIKVKATGAFQKTGESCSA